MKTGFPLFSQAPYQNVVRKVIAELGKVNIFKSKIGIRVYIRIVMITMLQ
jgi:hypothetical protein